MCTGVTLNRSLYETVLRALLLEGGEHTVEMYEGSGAHWRKCKCVRLSKASSIPLHLTYRSHKDTSGKFTQTRDMQSTALASAYREASPGKLSAFEDELFRHSEMSEVPVVAAVALTLIEGVRTLGVAYCDASARKLGACEFADDEHFCTLESVIVQLGAKEVVIPKVGNPVCLLAADPPASRILALHSRVRV